MAQEGEIEVLSYIKPKVNQCYQHIEATRSESIGGKTRYFSTNEPRYVGKFIKQERFGSGNSGYTTDIFNDNGKENRVDYSYEGYTRFIKVPCNSAEGGKRKTRRMRKKSKKTRK